MAKCNCATKKRIKPTKLCAGDLRDLVSIATSVSKPHNKQGIIDRFATRSFQWDVPAIVVFNKMDEFQNDFDIDFEMRRFENLGIECFEVSAMYPEAPPRFGRGSFKDLQKKLRKQKNTKD